MRISIIAVVAATTVVSLALTDRQVGAQQIQSGFTPQQLDQMSRDRQQEIGPRNWGPPPPQTSLPKETILPAKELWVCMSVAQWQPIYAAPNKSAPQIGKTLSQAAVSGRNVDGFARVLIGGGKIGYVPADQLRPYTSETRPGSTCIVEGVRPNGSPVFAYH
jgi:hypothetical protein